jgi:hypothetical protein
MYQCHLRYQWWIYRTDRSRPNEYGFVFEKGEEHEDGHGGDDSASGGEETKSNEAAAGKEKVE